MNIKILKSVISFSMALTLSLGLVSNASAYPALCAKNKSVMIPAGVTAACVKCHTGVPTRSTYKNGACESVASGGNAGKVNTGPVKAKTGPVKAKTGVVKAKTGVVKAKTGTGYNEDDDDNDD